MRRLPLLVLLVLTSTLVLATLALPGLATEGADPEVEVVEEDGHAEGDEHAEQDEHPGDEIHADAAGESQWTGLIGALVAAVLVGGYAFASAGTQGLGDHHDDH